MGVNASLDVITCGSAVVVLLSFNEKNSPKYRAITLQPEQSSAMSLSASYQ